MERTDVRAARIGPTSVSWEGGGGVGCRVRKVSRGSLYSSVESLHLLQDTVSLCVWVCEWVWVCGCSVHTELYSVLLTFAR